MAVGHSRRNGRSAARRATRRAEPAAGSLQLANELLQHLVAEKLGAEEKLRKLSAHLFSVREEERTRLARELHDELGQALTAIKIDQAGLARELRGSHPDLANRLDELGRFTDQAIHAMRRILTALRPGILDELGLVPAVEWLAKDFEARSGIRCRFQSHFQSLDLGSERSIQVFRLFQEALTNVTRHAEASAVELVLAEDGEDLVIEIRDNGRGMPERRRMESLGLLGMRERARILGGNIHFARKPGGGTIVKVRCPLHYATNGAG
jgi:signal transduction histidine kinase